MVPFQKKGARFYATIHKIPPMTQPLAERAPRKLIDRAEH